MEQEPTIGIDLGTTNSLVATVRQGQPQVIRNRAGAALTPSVVAIAANGKRLVGAMAKRQAITNATNSAYAVKRLIGRKFSSAAVQEARAQLPYALADGGHDDVRVVLGGHPFAVPELSAAVLAELKADAQAFFGKPVHRAVITVPAYFNDGQRQATKDAGRIAGLDVLRIVNEPTSAALAYGFTRNLQGRIVVFDLGGGTFDVSVLQVGGDVFEVLATGGDTALGGEDFDNRIIANITEGFAREHAGADLRADAMALQRLKEAAERAKCELSEVREVSLSLPFIFTPSGGGSAIHLDQKLTRERLETLTGDLVERCIEKTRQTLAEAGVSPRDISDIILVGGMTRMPLVAQAVRDFFGREPSKGVHPEEAVALGAAIQAWSLVEGTSPTVLLDVTPHSLGVAIAGGYARTIIAKNTTVPTSATELFSTSKDGQTQVKIVVLQGESERAADNELLGEFSLSGLRSAPRGEVEVAVTFDISADGIVSVSAHDVATGKRQSIVVTASGGMTREELERIVDEQRDFLLEAKTEEETRRRRQEVEALNRRLQNMMPRMKELLSSGRISPELAGKAERMLDESAIACQSSDLQALAAVESPLERVVAAMEAVVLRAGGENLA